MQHPNLRRILATAVIAVGLAGTIIDPNGAVGIILFSAAVTAAVYLFARPAARLVGALGRPAGRFSPARVPVLVGPGKLAALALTSGALLATTGLFDENGGAALGRILSDATFLGGFVLIGALVLIALGTAARWARNAFRAAAPAV